VTKDRLEAVRDQIVRPALAGVAPAVRARHGRRSTQWLRDAWVGYACAEDRMVPLRMFRWTTPVNPLTTGAFAALERALAATGYRPTASVWNYVCRPIAGSGGYSLHAYGRADTSFTPAQVAAVEAIRTVDGLQVFAWGGRWPRSPDAMHFQINVSPAELRRGLATSATPAP
jgi:hypothetical protein